MVDSSNIPNAAGKIVLNFGNENEEGQIDYFSRPNNTSIFIDSGYVFMSNHTHLN